MIRYPAAPHMMFVSFWRNRGLIWQMTRREVIERYRGSVLGLLWSFFNPLLMLSVYTFVFSVVFKARWHGGMESKSGFALMLFTGMIVHSLFAESVNRAPSLILSNVNYVKRVVFPLEILAWVSMGSTLFHTFVSLLVLLMFFFGINFYLNWTLVFFPILLLPLVLLTTGISWFLASTGVFIRDVVQTTGIITMVMLFLSPVFYSVSSLPEAYRPFLQANPLTFRDRTGTGYPYMGKAAELARPRDLLHRKLNRSRSRIRLVSENTQGFCRCPLTISLFGSKMSPSATPCTQRRGTGSSSLWCPGCNACLDKNPDNISANFGLCETFRLKSKEGKHWVLSAQRQRQEYVASNHCRYPGPDNRRSTGGWADGSPAGVGQRL